MKTDVKIKKLKMPQLYNFNNIFTYNPATGVITPQFNMLINNVLLPKDIPIIVNTPISRSGGVNLFQYIGRSFAGEWNPTAEQLTITGFY